jgi:H+/Cl- antiporter ClcA
MSSPIPESPIRSSLLETLISSNDGDDLNEITAERTNDESYYDSPSPQREANSPYTNARNSQRLTLLILLQSWLLSLTCGITIAASLVPLLVLMYSLRNDWFQDVNDASLFWPVISSVGGFISGFLAEILLDESRNDSIYVLGRQVRYCQKKLWNQTFIIFSSFVTIATGVPLGPEFILLSWGIATVTAISSYENFLIPSLISETPTVSRRMIMNLLGSIGGILFSSPLLAVVLGYEGWVIIASQSKIFDIKIQLNPPTYGRSYNDITSCVTAATSAYMIAQLFSFDSLLAPEWYPNWHFEELPWKLWYLAPSIALGILGGVLGFVFVNMLRFFSHLRVTGLNMFQQCTFIPKWFRILFFPTLSGAIHGCLCLWNPAMVGIGFSSLDEIISQKTPFDNHYILILAATKMLNISLCLGFGWIGGPLFPLLNIGGCLGVALSPFIPMALTVPCCMCAIVGSIFPFPLSLVFFLLRTMNISIPVAGAALIATVVAQAFFEGLHRSTGIGLRLWNDVQVDYIEDDHLEESIDANSDETVFRYDDIHVEEDESLVQAVRAAVFGRFR